MIIRDAFGRQQSIDLGFYLSTQLLKRGEQDYSYVVGLEWYIERHHGQYDRAMGTAVHNIGLSDSLTIGFQAEGAKDVVMGGAGFNARIWRLGTFGAEGLASQTADKEQGYAATGVYSFLTNWFSAEMRATWIGPKFQNLFFLPADQSQVSADASASVSLGRLGSLTAGWTLGGPEAITARLSQIDPDLVGRLPEELKRSLQDALATQHDKLWRLGYSLNLDVTGTALVERDARRRGGTAHRVGGLCLPDPGARLAHGGQRGDDGRCGRRGVDNRPPPAIVPLGPASASASTPTPRIRTGRRASLKYKAGADPRRARRRFSTRRDGRHRQPRRQHCHHRRRSAAVAAGGRRVCARESPGALRGVRVLANNQPVGRTGRRGSLFVPDLRSYLSSPIGIVQDDLPMEMKLGPVSQDIAVPYRGGAVVVFEANVIRSLTGRLDVVGEAPEYGTLSVTAGALSSVRR